MAKIQAPVLIASAHQRKGIIQEPQLIASAHQRKGTVLTPVLIASVRPSNGYVHYFDTAVNASADIEQCHDTTVNIQQDINIHADTALTVQAEKNIYCDTAIKLEKDENIYFDTLTNIEAKETKSYYFDTYTSIRQDVNVNADTSINLQAAKVQYYDTYTAIKADKVQYYDIAVAVRDITAQSVTAYFDTSIKANADYTHYFDTAAAIPYETTIQPAAGKTDPFKPAAQQEKPGPVSININLQELSLSDTFTMETTDNIGILDTVQGKIIDFPYLYKVAETTQQDKVLTVSGMYDVDELLYKSIVYEPGGKTHTLQEHAAFIAGALGKRLNFRCHNFTHSGTWIGDGQTYESIISSLFGWSSSIPHKAINVFFRAADNSLNIIQRGQETKTIDITDTAHTRPLIHRELMRTMVSHSSSSDNSGQDKGPGLYVEPLPFWGTLKFGDALCSYESGYLRTEEINGEITTYDYTGDGFGTSKYLSRKTTRHSDGSTTTTTYDYSKTKTGVMVLGIEIETTRDKNNNETVRKTIHAPLGGGFYGTSVYIDGEYQGSTIGTGSPAATASRYLQNQESITLGGANYGDSGGNPLGRGNVLKETANIPTTDNAVMSSYLNELKWLNRKVKETVTMDIYNYNHVIDFTDKVVFKGNTYYLISNTINQNPTELKQSIQLVRWY